MVQRNMKKEKIGGFYLGNQALFKFTYVDSLEDKGKSLGRPCWWPPLSLSTGPLMGIYSSEDHQPGVILRFPNLNIFLSLSGSSCLFPFCRWGRRLVWETTVIPSAILTFPKLIPHNGSIQIQNAKWINSYHGCDNPVHCSGSFIIIIIFVFQNVLPFSSSWDSFFLIFK